MKKGCLLVLDAEAENLLLIDKILANEFDILAVKSLDEFVLKAQSRSVVAGLIDAGLCGAVHGFDAIRAVQVRIGYELPIFYLLARHFLPSYNNSQRSPFEVCRFVDSSVLKPISPLDLSLKVNQLLAIGPAKEYA